jgi:hypothetical protein
MNTAKTKRSRRGKVIVLDPFNLSAGESLRRPIARAVRDAGAENKRAQMRRR